LILQGIKESILLNNIVTVSVLIFFLYCDVLGSIIFDENKSPDFFPNGFAGTMRATAIVFFGYTSFEQPVTVAEEAINPKKDLPKSLIYQILIETVQYTFLAYIVSG